MAFPDVPETLDLLGYNMQDKITGLVGVVTSVSFDLYGCVQVALHTGLDKDGKIADQHWFDVQRLDRLGGPRVMQPPALGATSPGEYDRGPADKPRPRAI